MSIINNTLNNLYHFGSQVVVPEIASKVIQAGFNDPKIGNILLGAGLISSGVCLIVSSGIPALLSSRVKGTSELLNNQKENSTKQIARWGLACAGVAATALGIYTIASTLMPNNSFEPQENPFEKAITPPPACRELLLEAKKEIDNCPAAKEVWDHVRGQGEFTVECLSESEINHPSLVYIDTREIFVSTYQPQEEWILRKPMSEGIIFELNNIKRAEEFQKINFNACELNSKEYSEKMEKIEYLTVKDTHGVVKTCLKGDYWTNHQYTETPLNITSHLDLHFLAGHTSAYQIQWYKWCNPAELNSFRKYLRVLAIFGIRLPSNIDL